jgi:two-component system, NtrC family, response regulator HydG
MRGGDDTDRQDDSALRQEGLRGRHAWLRIFGVAPAGTSHRVSAPGTIVGRRADPAQADVLLDDNRASRQHARIACDDGAWNITDAGSRNGGFVDGAVLAPGARLPLADGAVIRLGDTVAVFHLDMPASDRGDTAFFPGISAQAQQVRHRVELLARAPGHVLVLGETGTGKERVARRIGRDAPAIVPVNCAELSRELARSELFGHVKGSFTGATDREGLIDAARHGVLFFDEIGELPLDVQGELLRFLEDGSYRPVGAPELRTSRARVVAATNVDLDAAVRAGTFRRDLLARLRASSPQLVLPPLRDRRLDIPGWADSFLREAAADAPDQPWTAGTFECLLLYAWPENLRELRSVVRGAVEDPREWPLQPTRLPARLQDHRRGLRGAVSDTPLPPPPEAEMPERPEPTRLEIETALRDSGGRMRAAAELLAVDRRKLYRLCERYGVDPNSFR